tara:strand:+ start:114 stop:320 length:207 start_codon:yes stop_codon:yes gene_type:complete
VSKFFDYEDSDVKRWYHIKARDMNIFKPEGKVIKFWIFAYSENDVKRIIIKKGYVDIEWIKLDNPPFI